MGQMSGLAAAFLAHAKVGFVPPADDAAFERLLAQAWETSRAQWPTVVLPAEAFVTHIARRLPEVEPHSPIEPLLEQLSLTELYLACACLRGIPSAIELFERHYLAKLPGMLRGPKQSDAMIDDVCQMARMKILVSTPEEDPKIAEYMGRGALMSWVHVTAVRIFRKMQDGEKPTDDVDVILPAMPAPGLNAELDLIRARYSNDFRQAVREAFSVLSADERYLLRHYYVNQLSTYAMGALLRVNQSTVSRKLGSARERVYEETKRRLQARLGLSSRDFESHLAALDSQFDLDISQLMREGDDDGKPD